jgi:predicted methyltransferase
MKSDFNEAISRLSEVVQNRPKPIREFDQIFMKNEDMVKQAAFLAHQFSGLKVVFVGDGDSMALAVLHLWKRGLLPEGPAHLHVLDFDERIVKAINRFAEARGYREYIAAELYNVAEPLPRTLVGRAEAFYTNPPWGASNGGESVIAFAQRGIEALNSRGLAAVVVANDPAIRWTQLVLQRAHRACR